MLASFGECLAAVVGDRRTAALCLSCVLAAASVPARAATPAGTSITNVATIRYQVEGTDRQVDSNSVGTIVAERLDVTLVRDGDGPVVVTGPTAIVATLTNTGNGHEAFVVSTATGGGTTVTTVAIDSDGDGRFDPAKDALLVDGRTPELAAGATLRIVVVVTPGPAPVPGALTITATAATGSGAPGTTFATTGDGGGDAVTGQTDAAASVAVPLVPGSPAPSLVKTQSVLAPDGSTHAVRDAVITYTLEARFPGAAAAVRIADPIPPGTIYVAGSLRLDGAALSDTADADPGSADAAGIAVALGDIATAIVRTVQFQVKIQ